jgi:hypothetical protein
MLEVDEGEAAALKASYICDPNHPRVHGVETNPKP